MAGEYVQETGGDSLGGAVGKNVAWMAFHRARQQSFAYSNGPLMPKKIVNGKNVGNWAYTPRTYVGYTSTIEELGAWNSGKGMAMGKLGSPIAGLTRDITTPLLGSQMLVKPGTVSAETAFHGTALAGKFTGTMDAEKVGSWMIDRMAKTAEGAVKSKSLYNQAVFRTLGGTAEAGGERVAGKAALEVLEKVGPKAAKMALEGSRLSSVLGYGVPIVGQALMAYDIATVAYYGFTGVAKLGEAIHYKIPKAYFQASMKQVMRGRFEGIGPATVMDPGNMNNRARAVQAIQGSRLNARSALGNEAGLLHGHFG